MEHIFSQIASLIDQLAAAFSFPLDINSCPGNTFVKRKISHPQKYLWIIDNGHGESTPGKRSPLLEDGTQLREYKFNRVVSEKLMKYLEEAGVKYFNLVPESDIDVGLYERVVRANNLESDLPKILISIHGNAFGSEWTSPSGIETYHHCKSRLGPSIANIFQNRLAMTTGWKDRGVKTASFYILKHTNMPAILTENGFFTNKEECKKMMTDFWCDKIARAHFDAIMEIESEGL